MPLPCAVNKIDSNITALYIAEELCLGQVPVLALDGADAVWQQYEPNSYSDFGGEVSRVARSPIDAARQKKKGTVTDIDVSGGFNQDFTKSALTKLLQGFFFADARQKASTKPLNAASIPITSVTSATKTYAAGSGLAGFNKVGNIALASGFTNSANNGIKTVASATATTIVVNEALVNEPAPPVKAALELVGYQGVAADINFAVTSGIPSLVSTALDFTTLGLIIGEWIFIGGDTPASNSFVNNVGYGRIASITANSLVFDDVTFAPVTESGAGKTIRIFFGTVIKNENTLSLIKRRSYNLERQLGMGANGVQAEYLEGAVPNEFTLNIPQADKLNCDLTFAGINNAQRSGDPGDTIKPGARLVAPFEDAYNTSSDIFRIKMAIVDPNTSSPTALFGYVSEASLTVANGVSGNKAIGKLGNFDMVTGDFDVGGSITAYFTTVSSVKAVRNNADVGLSIIIARNNSGFLFDIPLLSLGGGRLNVEKDAPITIPLENNASQNKNGYTLLHNVFPYLPTVAMPR